MVLLDTSAVALETTVQACALHASPVRVRPQCVCVVCMCVLSVCMVVIHGCVLSVGMHAGCDTWVCCLCAGCDTWVYVCVDNEVWIMKYTL